MSAQGEDGVLEGENSEKPLDLKQKLTLSLYHVRSIEDF